MVGVTLSVIAVRHTDVVVCPTEASFQFHVAGVLGGRGGGRSGASGEGERGGVAGCMGVGEGEDDSCGVTSLLRDLR